MSAATPDDDQQVEPPARSKRAGELYRFQAAWWQKLPGYLFAAVVLIGCATFGGELVGGGGGVGQSTPLGVVLIVVGLAIAYGLWRGVASQVVITEQGLKIRNHLRNYHLTWDQIDGYEAAGHHYLRLTAGRRIRLYGLAEGPLGADARTVREGECLRSEIARHAQGSGSPVTRPRASSSSSS